MTTKEKTTIHKDDFIDKLASMTPEEINDFIKSNGKGPKTVQLYHLVNKNKVE